MFIDLRSLGDSTVLETDICILGAGPAGISMARTFIGTGMRVILVESGDLEFNGDTQALYAGESVGCMLGWKATGCAISAAAKPVGQLVWRVQSHRLPRAGLGPSSGWPFGSGT